jgi:hypothetical protein
MCTVTTYIVHVHVIFYRVSPSTCAQFVIVLVSMVQKKCSANIGTCVHMCTHVCTTHVYTHMYVCIKELRSPPRIFGRVSQGVIRRR